MVAELEPRVILPSAEKQKALGIAEETMLIPVGARRAITACPTATGDWAITEYDTSSGDLVPLWQEKGALDEGLVIAVVLGAAVGSLQEQLELSGAEAITGEQREQLTFQHAVLKARHTQLVEQGLDSFEFETA